MGSLSGRAGNITQGRIFAAFPLLAFVPYLVVSPCGTDFTACIFTTTSRKPEDRPSRVLGTAIVRGSAVMNVPHVRHNLVHQTRKWTRLERTEVVGDDSFGHARITGHMAKRTMGNYGAAAGEVEDQETGRDRALGDSGVLEGRLPHECFLSLVSFREFVFVRHYAIGSIPWSRERDLVDG